MKIILDQYSAYHQWANNLLIEKIKGLPEELRKQEVKSSFPSLTATFLHIWDAESIWWQRIKLQEQITIPSQNSPGGFEEITKSLMQQSKLWHEWITNAQEHMFEHQFIYQNTKREQFKQPVYQMLLHMFNHGTYHRGQVVNILRQLEVGNIPQTDFIVWSRKKQVV